MVYEIEELLGLITDSSALWFCVLLFGSALVENLFPPYPGDTVIIVAGYLVGLGRLNFIAALLMTVAGSLAGASLLYWLGRAKGRHFFLQSRYRCFSPQGLQRVEAWFRHHGQKIVLASRFLAGVRSLVAVSAGIGRMRYGLFVAFSLVSILVWNGLLLFLGLKVGQNWERVIGWFRLYRGLIITLMVLFALLWYLNRRGIIHVRKR